MVPIANRVQIVVALGLCNSDSETWHLKWRSLHVRSKRRQIECTLSFKQFLKLALRAGLKSPDEIGRHNHQYNLARYGDAGGYTPRNCRFVLSSVNRDERVTNGGIERGAAKRRGLTKDNCEWRARTAQKLGRPFCVVSPKGKVIRGSNLTEFCRKHNLNPGCIRQVMRGTRKQSKGWTQYAET